MTSRERVVKALNHEEPDRVPIDLGSFVTSITSVAHRNLRKHLGIRGYEKTSERTQQLVFPCEEILQEFHVDIRYLHLKSPKGWKDKELPGNIYEDEFGVRRKKTAYYYDIVYSPLSKVKTIKELEQYEWPDPRDPQRYEGLEEEAEYLHNQTDYAISNANTEIGSIFENSWYLRGFEEFVSDLISNTDFAQALLDKWVTYWMAVLEELLGRVGKYLQVVNLGDDIATQSGLLLSPDLYRKVVKPHQKRLFQFIKARTNAKLFYHVCGAIYPLIEDLIEIGVDIIHPVQPEAKGMGNTRVLKEEFGERLSFWGGISQQRVMPFGDTRGVENEVKKRIEDLASGGGYVFCTGHNIQPDVPTANICAAYEAARRYGNYPI